MSSIQQLPTLCQVANEGIDTRATEPMFDLTKCQVDYGVQRTNGGVYVAERQIATPEACQPLYVELFLVAAHHGEEPLAYIRAALDHLQGSAGVESRKVLLDFLEGLTVWKYRREYKNEFATAKGYWGPEPKDRKNWRERALKDYLAQGNGRYWDAPEYPYDGMIRYYTIDRTLERLGYPQRYFKARAVPYDAVFHGLDYWVHHALKAALSHADNMPYSRKDVQGLTKLSPYRQTRVGVYGNRNCFHRPIMWGDDTSESSLKENRLMRWHDNILMGFLGSDYDTFPTLAPDDLLDDWPYSKGYYYCESETAHEKVCDEMSIRPQDYEGYYVVPSPDGEIDYIFAGKGNPLAEGKVWVPGKHSKHWHKLKGKQGDSERLTKKQAETE